MHPKPDRSRCAECGTVLVWIEPTHPKHQGLAVPHCPCCASGKWDSRTCGPVPAGDCECGAPLQRFHGPNSGGALCPYCDEEHYGELVELGELVGHSPA